MFALGALERPTTAISAAAYAAARKAAELAPHDPAAANTLGLAAEARGLWGSAADAFRRARALAANTCTETPADNDADAPLTDIPTVVHSVGKEVRVGVLASLERTARPCLATTLICLASWSLSPSLPSVVRC